MIAPNASGSGSLWPVNPICAPLTHNLRSSALTSIPSGTSMRIQPARPAGWPFPSLNSWMWRKRMYSAAGIVLNLNPNGFVGEGLISSLTNFLGSVGTGFILTESPLNGPAAAPTRSVKNQILFSQPAEAFELPSKAIISQQVPVDRNLCECRRARQQRRGGNSCVKHRTHDLENVSRVLHGSYLPKVVRRRLRFHARTALTPSAPGMPRNSKRPSPNSVGRIQSVGALQPSAFSMAV